MKTKLPPQSLNQRVEREVERERHERALHDEARTGASASGEFRTKDARENMNSAGLKRSQER